MSSWAKIANSEEKEIKHVKIVVEKPMITIVKPIKKFNIFFRANILRTKSKKFISFEDWEYQYFSHLTKLFDILASHLENQEFTLNRRKASLQRKFNRIIFAKSSKYAFQDFELSENDQKQYDHYIKCLPTI